MQSTHRQHRNKTKPHISSSIYIDKLIINMSITKAPASAAAQGSQAQGGGEKAQEQPRGQDQARGPDQAAAFIGTQCLFPFPGQDRAPYFDGKNITRFLKTWDDLTLNWPDDMKVRKIPLYCETLIGDYIKTLPTFKSIEERERGGSWMSFKREVLEEFRDDDEEQQKYTEGYLRRAVARMEKRGGGLAEYRAFILDFCEKAGVLVQRRTINEHMRVTLFLAAFSDKIGDELCKKCEIDLDNPDTTRNVFSNLRKEALAICANEDSQMKKLRKQMSVDDAEGSEKLREN